MNIIEAREAIKKIQTKMALTGNWDECRFDAIEPLKIINEEGRQKHGPKWKPIKFENII